MGNLFLSHCSILYNYIILKKNIPISIILYQRVYFDEGADLLEYNQDLINIGNISSGLS